MEKCNDLIREINYLQKKKQKLSGIKIKIKKIKMDIFN